MRRLVLLCVLAGAAHANELPPPPAKPRVVTMAGRIVDERGQPVANAEVLACASWSTGAIVKTSDNGRWSAQVKISANARLGHPIAHVAAAPGREVRTVTAAGGAQHVRATLTVVGTGATIKGTAELDDRPGVGLHVSAECDRPTTMPVVRETVAGDRGAFELHDVGAAPCVIEARGPNAVGSTKITKIPADGVRVRANTLPYPRD